MAGMCRLEKTVDAMGCSWGFVIYGAAEPDLEEAFRCAAREIRRIESALSVFEPDSEWSRINRDAFRAPVAASSMSLELLAECLEYSALSEGAFDVAIGSLVELWGISRGKGRVPGPQEVSGALEGVGSGMLVTDAESGTVRLRHSRTRLDPGGIGKGYGVDLAARQLRCAGVQSALVSAGSSTIYGIGCPPHSPEGWTVLVHDPCDPGRVAAEFQLKDSAVSTSGAGRRVVWSGGRLYTHILDPRTGYPPAGMLQVTVSASRAMDSEAWSKPCFILGRSWATAHLPERIRLVHCVERKDDAARRNAREPS